MRKKEIVREPRMYRTAEEHIAAFSSMFNLKETEFIRDVGCYKIFGKKLNPYFTIGCIYNHNKEVLIQYDSRFDQFFLPGNSLIAGENLLDCLNRVVFNRTGMNIDIARPFCLAKHIFTSEEERVIQRGIIFLVQARPFDYDYRTQDLIWISRADLAKDNDYENKMYMDNLRILSLALDELESDEYIINTDEQDTSYEAKLRHKLHDYIISPLFSNLSSKKLRNRIHDILDSFPPFGSIIDVSCGTDDFLIEISNRFKGANIIANDLCWEHLCSLAQKDSNNIITYLNQDLFSLNFKSEFKLNVVIFKNTLHHLENEDKVVEAIERVCSFGKYIVVVDIEDPNSSNSLSAKLFHQYYKLFLHDKGRLLLSYDNFKKLIKNGCGKRAVNFDKIRTVKGDYMFAIIGPRQQEQLV